jgi:hypothetical protein
MRETFRYSRKNITPDHARQQEICGMDIIDIICSNMLGLKHSETFRY